MPQTIAGKDGSVDRQRLLDIAGRSAKGNENIPNISRLTYSPILAILAIHQQKFYF
ncbi:hypothetical protein D1BOALGB6SA_5740 [Olavius sp. associated proteobacterium Delta 1]|nr:hypothetical protein D1BOALGB6SA_5740 [Olavius sp. associated proteobacterium Delta 1]